MTAAFAPATADMAEVFTDTRDSDRVGEVCIDCLSLLLTGEVYDPTDSWDGMAAFATLTTYRVALGDEVTPFSTTACEVCATHDPGYRHQVVLRRF